MSMEETKSKKVAIIGAGTSGLVAMKCCLDEGLVPVCYERTSDIGGLWCFREYSDKPENRFSTTTVCRSTVTNISKEFMAFSDFPMPKEFPNYLHNSHVYNYLDMYAEKFNLKPHIVFNTNVKLISKTDDYDSTGRWRLDLENKDGCVGQEIYDAVLVCNGHDVTPLYPQLSGLEDFQGNVIDTKDYKRPIGYDDKRVLVVGIGNSACDVAVELARIAEKVYLSTRGGSWILSRLQEGGLPLDVIAIRRVGGLIPEPLREWKLQRGINNRLDHTIHPLKPKHGIFASGITVNDELPYHIVNGNIVLKPDVKRLTKTSVEFQDGTYEDIDCVILGTGYDITFPIDPSIVSVDNCKVHLYRFMFPPDLKHPTLAIIGLTKQAGPVNPVSELQSRWCARLIKGICKLPSEDQMVQHIAKHKEIQKKTCRESPRLTTKIDFIPYMDEIASEIGAKPDLWKMMFEDPMLSLRCFFGPCYPYQYRLVGPGKWDGAKEAIETAWDRITGAYQTRQVPEDETSNLATILFIVGLCGLLISIIYLLL
ncbi:dimethylaniline monooxygenase [N-oxide-forming] 2-like [Amphiura filiformis]|uniref:dimethylaniline monooxygenase [N-oxide-forming] 2-like n=1 Tax=Amphiura filiformis TaxID=82378 RepID=UPI003B224A79